MKQKLKEKFNVGDKVKKTNFTKCVKMSKEVENLKNGVLNGDSVISNNHIQQQQHTKLNNSNVDSTTKAIVGGRLQFYKDGKFILELARAREGEKTGWISVPRKTFWPPTISTNSSTTFSKHESSTSLSYSDDNSSIQSSPWQRDHCWKQSRPRHNISKEMTFFYNRPTRLYLTGDCQKVSRLMRRRPLHKCGTIKFNDDNIKREKKVDGDDVVTSSTDKKIENESDGKESTSSSSTSSPNDSKESISDTLDNNNKLTDTNTTVAASTTSTSVKMSQHKLDKILKKLADRISTKLALNGNSTNGHHANNNNNNNYTTSNLPPTSYSLASHIANSINTQPHQHVSPRKRILRELEKVSLEDTKRSRPKTNATINGNVTATLNNNNNHNNNNINNNTFSNGSLIKTEKAPTVSRPISSYSITSLLAHNTSTGCNNLNNNNSINSNDSLSTSHFHQQPQQQQRLSLNSPPTPPTAKSPQMMHNKRKSPNRSPPRLNQSIGSPSQSPSPEHHAFHKYRPITTTPTSNPASSSPYNSSYHSPNYMRGSPSPHDRLRTTGNFQHSPSHYGTSSPQQQQQNYSVGVAHRDSSLSPNVERSSTTSNNNSNNNNNRSTPTSSSSGIRTVPKKTAALRQQFSSPTMESSNKISKSAPATTAMQNMKNEKPMDVDSLLRPSALIPPSPMSAALGHPAAPLSHYPYMYPPLSYLQPTVPPYYPSFYNPAMMAAAVAYRFPIPGYPPTATSLSPVSNTHTPSQITNPTLASSSNHYDKNSNGHPRSSSISSSPPEATTTHHHSYVPTSPWNPISLTNHHHHSISDGNNLISKVKDEQSSDVPLNLSKH